VAQDIIREDRIKGIVGKREILRSVKLLEMYLRSEGSSFFHFPFSIFPFLSCNFYLI